MNSTLLNIAIVLALILLEACFVASEIALVSLREGQVRAMAERGRRGQAVARLIKDPNRFLATVQIGVTLTAAAAQSSSGPGGRLGVRASRARGSAARRVVEHGDLRVRAVLGEVELQPGEVVHLSG